MEQTTTRRCPKWTAEEDNLVLRQIRAYPHNLRKCFLLVSEQLSESGTVRTPTAVSARWYSVLSKRPDVLCFFTASSQHVSKNRKNGMGVEIGMTLWRRLVNIIRNIV